MNARVASAAPTTVAAAAPIFTAVPLRRTFVTALRAVLLADFMLRLIAALRVAVARVVADGERVLLVADFLARVAM